MFRSSESKRPNDSDGPIERLASRVQVLGERVDTLAQTVATTAAGIAKKDGELAVIRRELEQSRASVHTALSQAHPATSVDLDELRRQVAALATEKSRSSDDSRIAKIEGKIALLTERVDTLGTTVGTTAAGLAGRDGDIVALRRRVEQLASAPGGGPAIDDAFRERIDDLGAATAASSMRLESQSEQISSLRDAVDGLTGRIERIEHDRAALAASIGDAAAVRWSEVERGIASLAGRVELLENSVHKHDATLARASSLWPAALRSLEERVQEIARGAGDGEHEDHARSLEAETLRGSELSRFLGEIRAVEQRLMESEAQARHEREELAVRLRRIETEHFGHVEAAPVGADVLPFRGPDT